MNNELYYTPSLEEFHVGFEYERMNGDKWESAILNVDDCCGTSARGFENEFEEISHYIRDVRVKYLDKEDIQSLGFKFFSKDGDVITIYKKDHNELHYCTVGPVNIMVINTDKDIAQTVIKNKSELKVLLKQLGI